MTTKIKKKLAKGLVPATDTFLYRMQKGPKEESYSCAAPKSGDPDVAKWHLVVDIRSGHEVEWDEQGELWQIKE